MGRNDSVIVETVLIAETDLAYGIGEGTDDEPKWIPKSLVYDIRPEYPDRGDEITLEVPEWKAEEEGLEYT